MPDSTALPYVGLRYDDMPDLWDGFARLVRPALGITAFGVNVMDLPPDYETEAHDERDTGQEELYVALEGSGAVVVDGGRARLDLDPNARFASAPRRRVRSSAAWTGCASSSWGRRREGRTRRHSGPAATMPTDGREE